MFANRQPEASMKQNQEPDTTTNSTRNVGEKTIPVGAESGNNQASSLRPVLLDHRYSLQLPLPELRLSPAVYPRPYAERKSKYLKLGSEILLPEENQNHGPAKRAKLSAECQELKLDDDSLTPDLENELEDSQIGSAAPADDSNDSGISGSDVSVEQSNEPDSDSLELDLDLQRVTKVRFCNDVRVAYLQDLYNRQYLPFIEPLSNKATRQTYTNEGKLHLSKVPKQKEPGNNKKFVDEIRTFLDPENVYVNEATIKRVPYGSDDGQDIWKEFLNDRENRKLVASVNLFEEAPFCKIWQDLVEDNLGRKFEMKCSSLCNEEIVTSYRVATVVDFVGYLALVREDKYGSGDTYLYWINYFDGTPKPIGYGAKHGIPEYIPAEWNVVDHPIGLDPDPLDAVLSIDPDHTRFVKEYLEKDQKFKLGILVEVVDHKNTRQMRLAKITERIGDRVKLTYETRRSIRGKNGDDFRWHSERSWQIRRLGWSKAVGHGILEADDPRTSTESRLDIPEYPEGLKFEPGEFLEAVHPEEMGMICGATVHSVLKFGFIMVKFETRKGESFCCFHATSPIIFHCGFCEEHGITLIQPLQYQDLTPETYLSMSLARAAPLNLRPPLPPGPLTVDMRVEAADLNEPKYIGPATVQKIAGHMLFLRLDKWCPEGGWYPQDSPDIFPAGYCGVVGHPMNNRYTPDPVIDVTVEQISPESGRPKRRRCSL